MGPFRKKLLDFKQRLSDRHMYSIVLVATALIASAGIYQYKKAIDYRNQVENQYNRSFHELVGYVENLEVSLAKGMLVSNPEQMAQLSSEIWRKAAFAQANLGQLPVSHLQLDKTSKFLTQVGDFTFSLSRKSISGQPVSDDEFAQLDKLHKYAASLSQNLNGMQGDVYEGRIKFGKLSQVGNNRFSQAAQNVAVTQVATIEKEFQDYPSLIYDGPFSDHIERMEPIMLRGGQPITQDQAKDTAVKFIGQDRAKKIESSGESNGNIPTYNYTVSTGAGEKSSDKRITINITKTNGLVLSMLDSRPVNKINLNMDQAIERANTFLNDHGYKSMKESYYIKNDGIATLNYAYVQDNVIMYTDLIKVKVALDNGDIIGFESKGYIMAHQDQRQLPAAKITPEQAKAKINKRLTVEGVNLAVIPLESKREVLCYEFKGKFEDRNFLIYINAETGKEEKILMLLETPNGVLTM